MAKSKPIEGYLKMQIPAGQANPSPPVGPALGQRGLNIMDFCKAFNEATSSMEKGIPTSVVITIHVDKSFKFIVKTPPASYYLKKMAGLEKGGSTPARTVAGSVTWAQCQEIAKTKMEDLNANDVEAATHIIAGTARSMGFEVQK